jgi:hypothetical protein
MSTYSPIGWLVQINESDTTSRRKRVRGSGMDAQQFGKLGKKQNPLFRGRGRIFSLDKPPLLVGWLAVVG